MSDPQTGLPLKALSMDTPARMGVDALWMGPLSRRRNVVIPSCILPTNSTA